jgi:hypothetical protein
MNLHHDTLTLILFLSHTHNHTTHTHKQVVKKMNNKTIRPRDIVRYIKAYAVVFKEGKLPKAMTLVRVFMCVCECECACGCVYVCV